MLKRFALILMCVIMVIGIVVGCGGGTTTPEGSGTGTSTTTGGNGTTEPIVLKFGMTSNLFEKDESVTSGYAIAFQEELDKVSGGNMTMDIYPNGQLGGDGENLTSVVAGTTEIGNTSVQTLGNFAKSAMIFTMPGSYRDLTDVRNMIATDFATRNIRDAVLDVTETAMVLFLNSPGLRSFANGVDREMRVPADVKGLKFRVVESPMPIAMVESLGGAAVPMPISDFYMAMMQKVLDGTENCVPFLIQDMAYEVCNQMVMDKHYPAIESYAFSGKLYNTLSDEQKGWVEQANDAGAAQGIKAADILNETGMAFLAEYMNIYTPTDAEFAEWQKAVRAGTEAWMRSEVGDELVDEFFEVLADIQK